MASRLVEEINAELLAEQASNDGAIEPFEIRRVVAGATHPRDAARKPGGFVDEGNVSETGGVDSFVTVVKFVDSAAGVTPFEDEASTMGGLRVATEERSSDRRVAGFFDDQNDVKGTMIAEDTMPSDMVTALRAMNPSTVNMVPDGFVHVGMHGFDEYVSKIGPRPAYYRNTVSPPYITSLSHRYVFDEGGETVTIRGGNFQVGALITIGPNLGDNQTYVSENELTFDAPAYAGLTGAVNVTVRNPDGIQTSSRLTYVANDMMNGFRLTGTSGTPVTNSDSTNVIYLTPYTHGRIALYNGTIWVLRTSSEVSLTLSGLTSGKNYDVFAYDNAGTVALELSAAWTTDNSRADTLTRVSGVLVKGGATTRRYVGTIRTTSTTTTTDSVSQRYIFNYYNRVEREMYAVETTSTWSYVAPSAVWRQARATTTNAFEYVCGDADTPLMARVQCLVLSSAVSATTFGSVGIGIDSTTSNSAITYGSNPNSTTLYMTAIAEYRGIPSAGYHKVYWLETGTGANTYTFAGNNGTSTTLRSGIIGSIAC